MVQLYRNDYQWRQTLKVFANSNPIGKLLKPFLKNIYRKVDALLPQPRDFLLRMIPRSGTCAEVGVYEGHFTRRIFDIARPSRVYVIDPWLEIPGSKAKYNQAHQDARYEAVRTRLSAEISTGSAIIIRDTSDAAALLIPDLSLDFVYIDGDHSYEQVAKDLKKYWPKLKNNGLLSGDDYRIPDITRAVAEHCAQHQLTLKVTNDQFIIVKP